MGVLTVFGVVALATACSDVKGLDLIAEATFAPDGDPSAPENSILGTSQHYLWEQGNSAVYREWNSGNTSNLSGWQQVTCFATYGPDNVVAKLRGYEESRRRAFHPEEAAPRGHSAVVGPARAAVRVGFAPRLERLALEHFFFDNLRRRVRPPGGSLWRR